MAGFDFSARLRRGLGRGKVVPAEVIAKQLAPFDSDKDDALTSPELAAFFKKHGLGPWVSGVLAKNIFTLCETWYGQEIVWIKTQALGKLIHDIMAQPPTKPVRRRLTPEGMQGYEELETLEAYEARERREGAAPPRSRPPTRGPGPRGRPEPRRGRPGPRRPGPRR